jgi:hypothetical protein
MPSKWLTWSPQTASDTNVELTKPTQPSEVTSEGTCSTAGDLQRLKDVQIFPHCPRCLSYDLYRSNGQGD